MSQAAPWRCLTCKRPLGRAVEGTLHLAWAHVAAVAVQRPGYLSVTCACGTVRDWVGRARPVRPAMLQS
jgi:hypothetical protein